MNHSPCDQVIKGLFHSFAKKSFFDADVFDIIRVLKPSARGELEIVDVINAYIKRGTLEFSFLPGHWTDSGTFYSLMRSNLLAMDTDERRRLILELESAGLL